MIIVEAKPAVAQLFSEHATFLTQVVDRELLLLVHPSGHRDQQKPERIENLVHLQTTLCQPSQHVRVLGRYRIRYCARGAHVIRPGSKTVRRQRARASQLRAKAISPSTNAAAPPTTPLPVPGPPVAIAKFSPPLTTAISPATRATIAPNRPEAVPKRLAGRARASAPMTTPTSASTATVVAQSRRGVRP